MPLKKITFKPNLPLHFRNNEILDRGGTDTNPSVGKITVFVKVDSNLELK